MNQHLDTITNDPDDNTQPVRTRGKRSRFTRVARILAVPAAALTFAVVQAPVAANAATSAVGTPSATVGCLKSGNTEWMTINGSAIQAPGYASQYVSMEAEYSIGSHWYSMPWSSPVLVNANKPVVDAYGTAITVSGPQAVALFTSPRIANGAGRVTAYVQGAFWDGHAYEYSGWVPASFYNWNVNGMNYTGGPAPCGF
jgi:hypothetical protein